MILTFGHSTLALAEARTLLRTHDVQKLVDVRSHPVSNHVPQWNKEELRRCFGDFYTWLPELGGWSEHVSDRLGDLTYADQGVDVNAYTMGFFPKNRIGRKVKVPEGQPGWTSQGLHDYAWYMTTPAFQEGISYLMGLEQLYGRVAIFCSEVLWWKCHRSQVADALCYGFPDLDVHHLQPKWTDHRPHAERRMPRYAFQIRSTWNQWWRV